MLNEDFQIGDRVVYIGFASPAFGTVVRVNVEKLDHSPDAIDIQSYDIHLDDGGSLLRTQAILKRAL